MSKSKSIVVKLLIATMLVCVPVTTGTVLTSNVSAVSAKTTVKINKSKVTITKGKTYKLKVSGTTKKVKWTSSNKKVATVNSKGKVTAKKKGTATITAKVGGKKYKCKVTVKNKSSKVKLNKSKVTITKGKTYKLKVSGTTKKVKWTSSNKKVATVNSKGKVTAKKKGTATITAKVGGKKYKCKVTVKTSKHIHTYSYLSPNIIWFNSKKEAEAYYEKIKTYWINEGDINSDKYEKGEITELEHDTRFKEITFSEPVGESYLLCRCGKVGLLLEYEDPNNPYHGTYEIPKGAYLP